MVSFLAPASPWAYVDRYLPYQGKVVTKMKTPQEQVLVRIPSWTNRNQVACKVNGAARECQWFHRVVSALETAQRYLKRQMLFFRSHPPRTKLDIFLSMIYVQASVPLDVRMAQSNRFSVSKEGNYGFRRHCG